MYSNIRTSQCKEGWIWRTPPHQILVKDPLPQWTKSITQRIFKATAYVTSDPFSDPGRITMIKNTITLGFSVRAEIFIQIICTEICKNKLNGFLMHTTRFSSTQIPFISTNVRSKRKKISPMIQFYMTNTTNGAWMIKSGTICGLRSPKSWATMKM